MKKTMLILTPLISIIALSGCTIELKATEIEASGQITQTYQVDGFTWTEPGALRTPEIE